MALNDAELTFYSDQLGGLLGSLNDLKFSFFTQVNDGSGTFTSDGWTFTDSRETVFTMTSALVDAGNGTWQKRTLAGAETLTFTLAAGQAVMVDITFAGQTLAYTNVDEWIGGAAPGALTGEQRFVFTSDDAGTTVVGQLVGEIA